MIDSIFWLKCKRCMHVTHLQCAIKAGFAGYSLIKKIDGEYWCQSCEVKVNFIN